MGEDLRIPVWGFQAHHGGQDLSEEASTGSIFSQANSCSALPLHGHASSLSSRHSPHQHCLLSDWHKHALRYPAVRQLRIGLSIIISVTEVCYHWFIHLLRVQSYSTFQQLCPQGGNTPYGGQSWRPFQGRGMFIPLPWGYIGAVKMARIGPCSSSKESSGWPSQSPSTAILV